MKVLLFLNILLFILLIIILKINMLLDESISAASELWDSYVNLRGTNKAYKIISDGKIDEIVINGYRIFKNQNGEIIIEKLEQ